VDVLALHFDGVLDIESPSPAFSLYVKERKQSLAILRLFVRPVNSTLSI
jgi:hypothetical protein